MQRTQTVTAASSARAKREEYARKLKEGSVGSSTTNRVARVTKTRVPTQTRRPLATISNNTVASRSILTKRTAPEKSRTTIPAKRARTALSTKRPVSRNESEAVAKTVSDERRKEILTLKRKIIQLEESSGELSESLKNCEEKLISTTGTIKQITTNLSAEQINQISLQGERDRLMLESQQNSETMALLQMTLKDAKERGQLKIETARANFEYLSSTHNSLKDIHSTTSSQVSDANQTILTQEKQFSHLESSLREVKQNLSISVESNQRNEVTIRNYSTEISSYDAQIEQLQATARQDELTRRKLHETILDLKGTVRVFVRVCSVSESESESESDLFSFPDPWRGQTLQLNENIETTQMLQFDFDKVFGPSTPDSSLHNELNSLIDSSVNGNTVNIFTYGNTGCTLPLQSDSQSRLLFQFACSAVTKRVQSLESKGWEFSVHANCISIQGDQMKNLFTEADECMLEFPSYGIEGISYVTIIRGTECEKLLDSYPNAYSLEDTTTLLQIHLSGTNKATGEATSGLLNIVCLAQPNSEKDKNSSITLSKVITSLANQEQNVPYRKSRITSILRSSLTGNAKTLFVVNLLNTSNNVSSHLDSLRFAKEINSCNIGSSSNTQPSKRRGAK